MGVFKSAFFKHYSGSFDAIAVLDKKKPVSDI